MARREISFLPEHYYHIFNRGNNKQRIFLEDENYRFFLRRLDKYFDPAGIELIAYCLMPNHFHAVAHLQREIDFSNVMRSFSISYIKSFNRWHKRVGHVFQGDFQARHVDTSDYLMHVCRYIHLNPVPAGLVRSPELWKYSDYREWISQEADERMPNIRTRNQFFGTAGEYQKFVMDFAEEQRLRKEIEDRLFGEDPG